MVTTAPASLIRAYRAARYQVLGPVPFLLRPGRPSAPLRRWMAASGARSACLITAHNPGSRRRSTLQNRRADARLRAALAGLVQRPLIRTRALDPSGRWPAEDGYLALGLRRAEALALARRFGQNAVLWAGPKARPRLCWI